MGDAYVPFHAKLCVWYVFAGLYLNRREPKALKTRFRIEEGIVVMQGGMHMVFHCKLYRFYMFVSLNCVTDVSGLMVMLGHFHGPPSCSDPFVVVRTCDSISKDPRSHVHPFVKQHTEWYLV